MGYHLQKYRTKDSRHECPNCHDKHSFTYYVDDDDQPLDPSCGRCNRESSCGYHYPPKQFFQDHPTEKRKSALFVPKMQVKTQLPKRLCTIPFKYVRDSASYNSTFVRFLYSLFNSSTIKRLGELYAIGATNDGDVIFWQIDVEGRVRSGKIMSYYPEEHPKFGHRVKNEKQGVSWVHSILMKRGELPPDWELTQCLFGEHLLNLSMNRNKTVALVESEKSALIGAACFPNYVWLATGGKSQFSPEKMKVLKGRTVILFPDADGYKTWKEKAQELTFCKGVIVSDVLEKHATDEERAAQIDIADWLVKQLKNGRVLPEPTEEYQWLFGPAPKTDLKQMIEDYPFVQELVDTLELREEA